MAEIAIEQPACGVGGTCSAPVGVYAYDEYPPGSVLEGTIRRRCLGTYGTVQDAIAAHPGCGAPVQGSGVCTQAPLPVQAPPWFDPTAAGERWADDE